jgi:methylamine utilization protein MauE
MAELVIAALMTAVVTYGMSAATKLRSGQAYRAFSAGLAATALVSRRLTGPVAVALAGAEVAVAGLCATALTMTFLSRQGALAGPALTVAALAAAAALTAVLTAGVAVAVRRGVAAPCACFGSGGRAPLSGVHLTRNACLLAVLVAGVAGAGIGRWPPGPAAAALAAAAGGVSALLLTRLDDLTALFGTAAR